MFAKRSPSLLLMACAVLPLTACKMTPRTPPLSERMEVFMRPYESLKRQKADLWRVGHEPQVFDFPDAGRVTVKRWELIGWPGDVYVQARIHYENTTDEPRSEAFVWLDVLDDEDQVVGSTAMRLVNPMGYPFWPGHGYVTEIRARTNGSHLDPDGWNWTIACEAPVESDPGPEKRLINHDLEDARAMFRPYLFRTPFVQTPVPPLTPGVTRW